MADSRRSTRDDRVDEHLRLYIPYKDLNLPIETFYKLQTSPEFLFPEEAILRRRYWGENVTYYISCGYLVESITGVIKGFLEGLKASEKGDTMKLRINRILNASGHNGRRFRNKLGVIGLLYAGLEGGIVVYRDTDDVINNVVAGFGTVVLFNAASEPRSSAMADTIGGLMVGVVVARKQVVKVHHWGINLFL